MSQRVTRPSNVHAHPGMIDRNPPRRSREEVQAEREAKAVARAQTEQEKIANINRLVAIEKAEMQKARDLGCDANDPRAPAMQAKARRPRKRPGDIDEGPSETPTKKKKGEVGSISPLEYVGAVQHAVAELDAHFNESGTGGSEDDKQNDRSSTDDEGESEGDDQDEGDEERPRKKRKGKDTDKKKNVRRDKGRLARDQISVAVAAGSSPFRAVRRVGSMSVGASQTSGNHSKTPQSPFGLVPNWQTAPFTQSPSIVLPASQPRGATPFTRSPSVVLPASQPRGATLGEDQIFDSDSETPRPITGSRSKSARPTPLPAPIESDNVPIYRYGGFMPDKEGLEVPDRDRTSAFMYKSITKIQDTHTPDRAGLNKPKKKRYLSYDDLPPGTKEAFKKRVIPHCLEITGALMAWHNPDDKAIVDIWNFVYDEELHIEDGIKRAISVWLHKFADTTERALLAEFTQRGLTTDTTRRAFIQHLLEDTEDISAKNRPFLWQTQYDNPSAPREGLFQGRLVARTFLEHVQVVNMIDKNHRVKERPIGALVLSIQAVHRALSYSVSGTFKLPADKKSAEFSKTNWDDCTSRTVLGEWPVKRASTFLKAINKLSEQQWCDIFDVALSFQVIGKQPKCSVKEEQQQPYSETDTDEDDELVDPRYHGQNVE